MDNKVAKRSAIVEAVFDKWYVVDTLSGGTERMREAGEKFLPRHPKESLANYNRRKDATFLVNFYNRTIQQGTGKIYSKNVVVNEAPPQIEDIVSNVDRMGQDLTQFSRGYFEEGLNYGSSYLIVDFPKLETDMTLADFNQLNARPYFVLVPTMDVLDVQFQIINNSSVMTLFRFKQIYTEHDNSTFSEITGTQIKVFHFDPNTGMVGFEVYRKVNESGDEWYVHDAGTMSVSGIPVVPFVTNRFAPGIGEPPLYDLAMINIQHWQSSSDQRNILTIARVPILFAKMLSDFDSKGKKRQLEISANTIVEGTNPESDLKWIEHGGKGIEAGRQDLKDLETYMAVLGLELYVSTPGGQTATEKAINTAEANSILHSYAVSLRDCLERAFHFVCEFYDIEMNFNVQVNTEFSVPFKSQEDFNQLLEMFKSGLLTGQELLMEAKRRNILEYTFDEKRTITTGDTNNDNQV